MATAEQEYELVYQGICAVAAQCDGAQTQDGVGFNGQDTKFGRRIASVPFDQWTDDVKVEAARIINRYQTQVFTYTEIDVTTLQVVQDAKDSGTNYAARDTARAYERRAKGADKLAERLIDVQDGKLSIHYAKRDPDKDALLNACRAMPGRRFDWDTKANLVPVSDAVEDFILEWDFPMTDAAKALVSAPRAVHYAVTLDGNGERVVIDTPLTAPGQPAADAVRALPGRAWDSNRYANTAEITPDVMEFANRFKLAVHPDVEHAVSKAQEALEAAEAAALREEDRRMVMAHVSRQKDPSDLPPVFLAMLSDVLPAAVAEKVIAA